MAGKRQERVNIALEFFLSYVIIYDNIQTKDGENMEELRQRRKIISQLVEARLEKGISQAELARMIGTQRSNVCRLESGTQNPTLDMIVKIASALGKDVSLLLNDKEGEGCDH